MTDERQIRNGPSAGMPPFSTEAVDERSRAAAQAVERAGKIDGRRRLQTERHARDWMREPKHARVQRLAAELGGDVAEDAASAAPVQRITEDGEAGVGAVDANLMSAP